MEEKTNLFMSAEVNEISAALSAFQGSFEQPKLEKEVMVRTKTGGSYTFKYADLSACCRAATPALKANGLAVAQVVNNGKLVTLLLHKSGQWLKSELYLPQPTNDYQSYGSAITYLKRYSYCALLGIVADTDDDANMACGNTAQFKERTPKPAYTAEQMKQAVADLANVATAEELQQLWNKWRGIAPALCASGTEFYTAVGAKSAALKSVG